MKSIPVILGPTASGKTEAAKYIVEKGFADFVLSADSRKIYKGFSIGTASPTEDELKKYHFEGIAFLEPTESFSANEFSLRASVILSKKNGRPIVEGGSNLYLRALFEGLFRAPPSDPALREKLKKRVIEEGVESLWNELSSSDPDSAFSIHKKDATRIIRALEVFYQTGKPMRKLWAENKQDKKFLPQYAGLITGSVKLKEKIRQRTEKMLENGMPEEAAFLKEKYGSDIWPMNAIGYKEAFLYHEKKIDFQTAVERISTLTWQYARKQNVWLKKMEGVFWVDCDNITIRLASDKILEHWKRSGL
ncbi:tRNA (adenosine(37)-N6)-dimethylallyltransferase MiaA [candidate division WOR-3 bacterium]|nr:tRNA (adenosine(37)-N6)-dimethylallyltransferase MiaA [candidate division WOR-3 bacterium]